MIFTNSERMKGMNPKREAGSWPENVLSAGFIIQLSNNELKTWIRKNEDVVSYHHGVLTCDSRGCQDWPVTESHGVSWCAYLVANQIQHPQSRLDAQNRRASTKMTTESLLSQSMRCPSRISSTSLIRCHQG